MLNGMPLEIVSNIWTEWMIQTEDLSKQFGDFLAVNGVNLKVEAGEVLALLGPNGAGKTTTVRMLTSVLAPSRGWGRVAGYDIVREAHSVRASVGVLTENHGLYNRMPAQEYLDFFGQLYGMDQSDRGRKVRALLEDFGLWNTRQQRVGEFSKGMRQKLALARALLHSPPVLLLDEPTSAMDPESARLVRNSIHELRSAERAIVICTHNLSEAEELADRIAIIRQGVIIAKGSPTRLKRQFLGMPEYEAHFSEKLNGWVPNLPTEVALTARGPDWLRFRPERAKDLNPLILRSLLNQGLPVISLQEVPRSLEQVYLQAMGLDDEEVLHNGG
jgi:ABC-2 type transport system ATP-binding protein